VPRTVRALVAAAIVVIAVVAGLAVRATVDGDGPSRTPHARGGGPPTPVSEATALSLAGATGAADPRAAAVARARARSVSVYRAPDAGRPARRVRARRIEGRTAPLVFAVQRRRGAWLKVATGRRPNASTGWIRRREVALSATTYRVRVELGRHRLVVTHAGRTVLRAAIAVGRSLSPTPTGRYFVTELLRPPDPRGFYGPYAFGLSAYSPVYTRFAGGDGQVGIHGTDNPGAIGRDVSHGCIRIANAVVARLARRLPLGTPVAIVH
jgi:lipoprotein-anchoring transpeptidase ErfK/SrfK